MFTLEKKNAMQVTPMTTDMETVKTDEPSGRCVSEQCPGFFIVVHKADIY